MKSVSGNRTFQVVERTKQSTWGRPALANFILGGTAASFYLIRFILIKFQLGQQELLHSFSTLILSPFLVGLGLLCVAAEAGRPSRSRYMLRRLGRSWMSLEAVTAVLFIIVVIAKFFVSNTFLELGAVLAASGLLFSQGMLAYKASAVTAWNVPSVSLVFVTSSLATGAGLLLLILSSSVASFHLQVFGVACATISLLGWLFYLFSSRDSFFRSATRDLRTVRSWVVIAGIGHLFPILLLLFLLGQNPLQNPIGSSLLALAALTMIVGGVGQKVAIISKADYRKEIKFTLFSQKP